MGRPERPLDPAAGPIQAFASELRQLRQQAGSPKYLQMQRRTGRSRTALAEAAGGDHLPTWETVEAYVRACGGDPAPWHARWVQARDAARSPRGEAGPAGPVAAAPPRRPRANRFHFWLTASVVAAVLAAAVGSTLYGFRAAGRVSIRRPVIVIVQNKAAIGPARLAENPAPAYLSSRPVPSCATRGCEVPRSQLWSGTSLQASCKIRGAMMTNKDLASPGIARNQNGVTSSLWYRCTLPNSAVGYLPQVYVAPAYRGGQGLPTC
jgi:Helix-turn-helix domain